MGALPREREIEIAWRRHSGPELARIPARSRHAVRQFKAEIAGDADRIKAAFKGGRAPSLIDAWAKKGALDRARKLLRIKEALSPAAVDVVGGDLLVLWLEPRHRLVRLDHPSFAQDCVLVSGAVGSRLKGEVRWLTFPIAEFPDHSLGRMCQRSPGIDIGAALYQAANAFLDREGLHLDSARDGAARSASDCGGRRPRAERARGGGERGTIKGDIMPLD